MAHPTANRGKRFARVLPLAFITYSLAYLDRVNYGFAAADRLKETLRITPNVSALISALFFIGYCFFQIPGAAYASHRSVRKLIFWALLLWGLLSGLTGIVRSIPALLLVRFVLGVVEGVVLPAMLIFIAHWFTRPEKSRANTVLSLGNPVTMLWASLASGYLIQFFNHHRLLGLEGWQAMFVVEGLPSIAWAFCWWFLADDRPADARWLSEQEAQQVQAVLDAEQLAVPPIKHYAAAFHDPRVVLFALQFFFWSVAIYGFVLWTPDIIRRASGAGIGFTGVLCATPYLAGILAMLTVSHASDRTLRRKPFVWPILLAGALFCLLVATPHAPFPLLFIALILGGMCMYAPYGPYWAMLPEMLPKTVVGESMALINSFGALGGFFGAYLVGWLTGHFGTPSAAFVFMAACLGTSSLLGCIVRPGPVVIPVETDLKARGQSGARAL